MMKTLDTFEWALILLLIGLFVVGIFVALDRHDGKTADLMESEISMSKQYDNLGYNLANIQNYQ